jgi:molecular chaperone HtpG
MSQTETRSFEAEVAQVLNLVTHSLYSHKEIFLRELISNASDACDKLRFQSLGKPELLEADSQLRLEISVDREARTLVIRDNGIGMSREEVVENIGTIARSGTRRFLETLSGDARKDTQLIGQFGVGFYSAFIVADRVVLQTRRAGTAATEAVRWESAGTGEYTLEKVQQDARGTTVTLYLKEDESEFLDLYRLRNLISKYSDHIAFPIQLPQEKEGKPTGEWETVNHASALWVRPKSELTDEDYQGFYKHISHDFNDALSWTHNRVEGNQSYTLMLFVPSKSPWDAMFSGRDDRKGLKLYIRRVFIMDASEALLPNYLRFIKGVVDSDDLPLNVSRELLQENKQVAQIRTACVKRSLDLLDKLAVDDQGKYLSFWREFGSVLKEGIGEDFTNRERIAKLMRFASTRSEGAEQTVSLDDYVSRMVEGQDVIYFISADTHLAARHSPQLEALVARGVEVLLWSDRIDEWMSGYLTEYAGKQLHNVAKGDINLSKLGNSADEVKQKDQESQAAPIVEKLKLWLETKVKDVRVSQRLVGSPACLVLEQNDMALHMQRLLKQAGHGLPTTLPILEINPTHALLQRLGLESNEEKAKNIALVLFEQAQLAEGNQLEDPAAFVKRVNALILGE